MVGCWLYVKTVVAYCFVRRIKLQNLIIRCVSSFLLNLFIEEKLNYWSFFNSKEITETSPSEYHKLFFPCFHSAPKTYPMFQTVSDFSMEKDQLMTSFLTKT